MTGVECSAGAVLKIPSREGWREGGFLRRLHAVAERRGGSVRRSKPPEVPPCPLSKGGRYSSNVASQGGMKNSLETELPSSIEEGMPGPTATAGVVGVPCSLATDRTTATAVAERRGGMVSPSHPPKSPLV